jgi:hypothetical protein
MKGGPPFPAPPLREAAVVFCDRDLTFAPDSEATPGVLSPAADLKGISTPRAGPSRGLLQGPVAGGLLAATPSTAARLRRSDTFA